MRKPGIDVTRVWNACAGALALALLATSAAASTEIVDERGRRIVLAAPPQRVISLSPSLTEITCELQACERLVGVDRSSNWPERTRTLPRLGGLEDTQIERIVTLKPDLVLAPSSSRAIDRLEAVGLTVAVFEPKGLADTERVVAKVAAALGQGSVGPALWRRIESRITAAAARVPVAARGRKVYVEVAAAPYAAGEASFIGEVLARLGLGNVVPAAMGPFPKLNPEYVVRARPDIVIAAARSLAEMPERPGWGAVTALRERRSCGFEGEGWDVLVRAGPRLAEAAERLADCLAGMPPWPAAAAATR